MKFRKALGDALKLTALDTGLHPVKQHAGVFDVKITHTAVR
jgi:hypothetical protein